MNITTIKNSITFLLVAFALVSAQSTFAYVPGVWDPQPRVNVNEPAFFSVPLTYDKPVMTQAIPVAKNTQTNTSSNTTYTKNTTKQVL